MLQAAALCIDFIPQVGACTTCLQGLERLLLSPFCFGDDRGCREDAVLLQSSLLLCQPLLYLGGVCVTREVFQGWG